MTIRNGGGTIVPTFDIVYGDGLRKADPAGIVPNCDKPSICINVNAGIEQNFTADGPLKGLTVRFDVRQPVRQDLPPLGRLRGRHWRAAIRPTSRNLSRDQQEILAVSTSRSREIIG